MWTRHFLARAKGKAKKKKAKKYNQGASSTDSFTMAAFAEFDRTLVVGTHFQKVQIPPLVNTVFFHKQTAESPVARPLSVQRSSSHSQMITWAPIILHMRAVRNGNAILSIKKKKCAGSIILNSSDAPNFLRFPRLCILLSASKWACKRAASLFFTPADSTFPPCF